jgi:hypothetical protein
VHDARAAQGIEQVGISTDIRSDLVHMRAKPDGDRASAIVYSVSHVETLQVCPHRSRSHAQTYGDLLVCQPSGDEAEHFFLPATQMDRRHECTVRIGQPPAIG